MTSILDIMQISGCGWVAIELYLQTQAGLGPRACHFVHPYRTELENQQQHVETRWKCNCCAVPGPTELEDVGETQ